MFLANVSKIAFLGTALAAISWCAGSTLPDNAPNVTFTASGKFGSPPNAGSDTLRLAGEPFVINIVANAASVPLHTGPNWAVFGPLTMTGSVHSGLLGPTPINIASKGASILQLVGPDFDIFQAAFPVVVVGIKLTINATIYLPPGTIKTPLIHPFAPVTTNPGNATVTYADGPDKTTLAVASGTLVATIPTGGSAPHAMAANPTGADLTNRWCAMRREFAAYTLLG